MYKSNIFLTYFIYLRYTLPYCSQKNIYCPVCSDCIIFFISFMKSPHWDFIVPFTLLITVGIRISVSFDITNSGLSATKRMSP